MRVTVRDDGRGLDPGGRFSGFGVTGMRERAELIGGTLDIESAPGHGSTVQATLPKLTRTEPQPAHGAHGDELGVRP